MATENYNIHQILFSLERFENDEEKLGYLYKMKKELQRVIRCFDSSKTLPLKMYAVDNIQIEGNCEELKTFIRKQFASEKNNPWEKHHPNEGKLNALLMKEVVEYKKITLLIDSEIRLVDKRAAIKKKENPKPEKTYIKIKEINHSTIASLLKENNAKIMWEFTIGELIELANDIQGKKLINNLNESNLPTFIANNFVDKNENNYSLKKVEKVYSMFLKTIWSSKTEINTRYFQ